MTLSTSPGTQYELAKIVDQEKRSDGDKLLSIEEQNRIIENKESILFETGAKLDDLREALSYMTEVNTLSVQDIRRIQEIVGVESIDGDYGANTHMAVIRFTQEYGFFGGYEGGLKNMLAWYQGYEADYNSASEIVKESFHPKGMYYLEDNNGEFSPDVFRFMMLLLKSNHEENTSVIVSHKAEQGTSELNDSQSELGISKFIVSQERIESARNDQEFQKAKDFAENLNPKMIRIIQQTLHEIAALESDITIDGVFGPETWVYQQEFMDYVSFEEFALSCLRISGYEMYTEGRNQAVGETITLDSTSKTEDKESTSELGYPSYEEFLDKMAVMTIDQKREFQKSVGADADGDPRHDTYKAYIKSLNVATGNFTGKEQGSNKNAELNLENISYDNFKKWIKIFDIFIIRFIQNEIGADIDGKPGPNTYKKFIEYGKTPSDFMSIHGDEIQSIIAERQELLSTHPELAAQLGDWIMSNYVKVGANNCGKAVGTALNHYGIEGLPQWGRHGYNWDKFLDDRPSQFLKVPIEHPDQALPGGIICFDEGAERGSSMRRKYGHVECIGSDGQYYSYYKSENAAGSCINDAKNTQRDEAIMRGDEINPKEYKRLTGFTGFVYYPISKSI